jgi:dihydrofolate reductase
MGKDWEQQQLEKLVSKQQIRIEKIKTELKKEVPHITESELYNEELNKNQQELTIIVAAAENNAIGKDNKLIWHLSDDLKRFKNLTNNHHIIMGRKTFESFPKPLPNRTHVVITRQHNYQVPEGVIVVNSLEKAIEIAKNDSQPFIIGGGEIYKQAMPLVDKMEITRVHENFEADTFFPEIDDTNWKVTQNIFHDKDDNHKYDFSFLTYVKK